MKTIENIIEGLTDNLGSEIVKGDWIEFDTKGITIIGEIVDANEPKITVKTLGVRFPNNASDDERKKIQASAKPEYKLNISSRKVYKLIKPINK